MLNNAVKIMNKNFGNKTFSNDQQRTKKIMYTDIIISFYEPIIIDGDVSSQDRIITYLSISDSKDNPTAKQAKAILNLILNHCKNKNLPFRKIWKISTACNWNLFEEVTNCDWAKECWLAQRNGKFCFIGELSPFEESIRKDFKFGADLVDIDLDDMDAYNKRYMKALNMKYIELGLLNNTTEGL
mgnify:CR=1 FL=1